MSRVPDTFQANRQTPATHSRTESPRRVLADTPITVAWKRELAAAVRSSRELLHLLGLSQVAAPAEPDFPVLVPHSFLRRMEPGNPSDPLLLQVLPSESETVLVPGFTSDAVGDLTAKRAPGLIQKYHGRVLLIAAGACAIHCRYCFRRDYPYQDDPRLPEEWNEAVRVISEDRSVTEVILSGGDPLMLSDSRLESLCRRIDSIEHVERIRIHSRMPIVLPSRVTPDLLSLLTTLRAQPVFIVHANHGNEIVNDCSDTLRRIVGAGIPVLNQAVLLKHVNDTVDTLEQLSRQLVNLGVMPYYLNQLDRVTGTAHFEVEPHQGLALIAELAKRLPGYAVPRYVQEIAGQSGKTPVLPGELTNP